MYNGPESLNYLSLVPYGTTVVTSYPIVEIKHNVLLSYRLTHGPNVGVFRIDITLEE